MSAVSRRKTVTWLLVVLAALLVALLSWQQLDTRKLQQRAAIEAASVAGTIAQEVLERADSERANQLHNVPVAVEQINDQVYLARGIGNSYVITTSEGHVLFDTGLGLQAAKQLKLLREQLPGGAITHIIASHSHADHIGGVRFWREPGTEVIAHADFSEEQRYLKELEPFFWERNRLLFPFIPESPPQQGLFSYGGVEPSITVGDWEVYRFEQGGMRFEVYGTPGAEGADNAVLWLPEEKMLFSGDVFGPLFPQFPNIFTMRGEKVRKPVEYIRSLDLLIALEPRMILPGHFSPVVGIENTVSGMRRIRDALRYVHEAVVAGMNQGQTVHQLMAKIELPLELELTQGHGKVSWAVRSIWQYYATWFHFDSTTELYPVPMREVYGDLADIAGVESLVRRAREYRARGQCVHALHLLEIALAAAPASALALAEREACLVSLLEEARVLNNTYEVMWLEARIESTRRRHADAQPVDGAA
jgi:alkyl sulfatase BDS1-like metallo-beta-lactamase superfamily hydrolase